MELYREIINAPHTLIAGTTGSGKSVVLNGIIREILLSHTDTTAELYMVDPKAVELWQYHNICKGYTEEAEEVPYMLDEVIEIMENRFKAMRDRGENLWSGSHIFIVIDELADLMISPQNKVIELKLQKILQKGRAARITIIAATQAPNRQIIPANLVLNFTNRLALRFVSAIESRQIVNQSGAELLPKYGKGIYLSPDGTKPVTIPLTPSNKDIIGTWEEKEDEEVIVISKKELPRPQTVPSINYDFAEKFYVWLGVGLMGAGLLVALV